MKRPSNPATVLPEDFDDVTVADLVNANPILAHYTVQRDPKLSPEDYLLALISRAG